MSKDGASRTRIVYIKQPVRRQLTYGPLDIKV
jgi:hypothetical protein